ncbi:hypothetical protein CYMTET_45944 [Cymbomonas tetramitiformis]|uniref:Uncharacterized protein n=1 Tax=Cymbomonas tetramitiformis TaxID=36881 RepID=A0AAE0BX65_9CHLO|nr:hypothetical protein CYMTET_45944 [Cymbomonas tetramitiformis]
MPSVAKNLRFEDLTATPTPTETPNNYPHEGRGRHDGGGEAFQRRLHRAADVVPHTTGAVGALNVASSGPLRGLDLTQPQPVEAVSEFRECFHAQDGRMLTRPPKQYSKEEFGYRLLQFARSMPDASEREVHFYAGLVGRWLG